MTVPQRHPCTRTFDMLAILIILVLKTSLAVTNALTLNIPAQPNISTSSDAPSNSLARPPNHETDFADIICFRQEWRQRPLVPINFVDCVEASSKILSTGLPSSPHTFHRTHRYPFPLPRSFTVRSCSVWLDMVDEGAEDTFVVEDILAAVGRVVELCGNPPFWMGGKTLVGPKRVMKVFVYGNWFQEQGREEKETDDADVA